MALPYPPIDPNIRIPNNPFYAPEQYYLSGEFGPIVVGSGLQIDYSTGTISATGGGTPGVTSITAGLGVSVSGSTGAVTINNTGVISIAAGAGIGVVKVGGNYTIINTAPALGASGTVTSITAGPGLAGGTITNSGTISLATSGVGPGTYANPTITVDAYGRITFASPGSGGGGGGFPVLATLPLRSNNLLPSTISIDLASTAAAGAVQLNDSVTSTVTDQAATPRAVKQAYDAATSAQATAGASLAASSSAVSTSNSACALASGASTNAAQALVCAANAQIDATQALTDAATAQATANTALSTANSANTTANTALAVANGSIQRTAFSAPGQLLVGTGASLFSVLNPGPNGFVLTAFSGSATGLTWCPATSSGTVTCVAAGTGLCGGPITSSGTLCLTDTGVLPGTYNNASFTVDAQGRISLASSNPTPLTAISASSPLNVTAGAVPVITICNASLGSAGVVQLYNATNSPSTTLALTAAQGKNLQDQINALGVTSNLTLAGTFDASASQMVTVTADGLLKGFVVGSNVPSPSSGNADYFVIVTTGGSYNPPGGGGPYNTSQGDWLLSNGASWQFLNVGPVVPYATTTSQGSVCLSTAPLAITGTDTITAITPAVARAAYVFNCDYTGKGAIVAGTGVGTTGALPLGLNGTVLTACPACPTGLAWSAAGAPAIPCACVTGKGAIITGTGAGLPAALPVGANDLILTADSTTSTGLAWATNAAIPCALITGKGDIVIGSASGSPTALPPGLDDYVLIADSSCTNGLKWAPAAVTGVTCVCTGTGLAGGPISSTGTIALADTLVTPGNYTYATVCVDQQGRLTYASDGVAPNTTVALPITNTGTAVEPIIGIQTATTGQLGAVQVGSNIDVAAGVISVATSSTTVPGIVQLNDTVASTSVTEALTAAQGKVLQDQINTLSVTTNLTLAGTFDATASQMLTVTSSGSSAGFTIGANLPASAPALTDFFVIVTTGGSYSPPGGGGPYTASQGDWFLNNGTSWQYLNVGTDLPVASTGSQGIVQLATPAQTATGTSTTLAVTPAGACATYIPYAALTAKGTIITASGANTLAALAVGNDGEVLTACPTAPSGLCWAPASTPSIPCACITAKGAIITGTAANTPTALPVGLNGQYLVANSACTTGLEWVGAMGDTPVGAVNWFSAQTAPVGWLVADGRAVSRTTYAALFAVVGTTYGAGDGSTTFNLPDLRGQFLRGWDAAGGIARGCDPGRAFGSSQGFALQTHCHNVEVVGGAAGRPEWACPNNAYPTGASYPAPSGSSPQRSAGFTSTIGSSETRPTNVALLPCIKWQVTTAPSSCGIPCACITAKGALITGTAADTPVALPVGTNGQTLIACSACSSGLTWATPNVNPQKAVSRTANVTLATEITTNSMVTGDSLTIYNSNAAVPPVAITITAATLTNYQTYPTQATATVFTLPPQGTVTLILTDSATNSWYIESYDTPEQVGTVVAKATLSSNFTFSTDTKIPLSSAPVNPQGYFNTTTNRFQPLVAGYYQINAQLFGNSGDWLIAQIKKNGAVEIQTEQTSSPNTEAVPIVGIVYLNGSTDYLELWGIANTSTTLSSQSQLTYFTASLINQTNTRVVGIDAVARMEVSAGTIANSAGSVEVQPGVNGVSVVKNFDPQSWFDTTTGRFTPTIPGYYQVDAYVTANSDSINTWAGIYKNGAKQIEAIQPQNSTGNWQTASVSTVVFMNGTTDYLRLGAGAQGATPSFITQNSMSGMSISLVGANQAEPIPPMTWIDAGTVQSVGIGAVISGTTNPGTAPTITAATQNNIRYRQIGPKEWEVQGILYFTNGTAGNGDYVFTLPGGLQFDLSSPYQLPYTLGPNYSAGWYAFGLPHAWAEFNQSGATTVYQSLIMPFDATRYRIVPVGPNGDYFWSSVYYGISNYSGWRKWSFTFFTP